MVSNLILVDNIVTIRCTVCVCVYVYIKLWLSVSCAGIAHVLCTDACNVLVSRHVGKIHTKLELWSYN